MRDIPVGNGTFLVTFDDRYQIRDIYFPHVGQENHTEGFPFKFGIWVDGDFSWIANDEWEKSIQYVDESLVTEVRLSNKHLGIELISNDCVMSNENIFLRRITVSNLLDSARNVRIFLHHDFRIYENKVGDTAFYDPESLSLIHYKKHRYFLINSHPHFDSFATGRKAFKDKEGTWRDAEDGELTSSAITEGSVDSTIQIDLTLGAQAADPVYYWIAAGTSQNEVAELNRLVLEESPAKCLKQTQNYSNVWVNKNEKNFGNLNREIIDLYKRSLLIIRTQIDNSGAIIAANDSDVTERATDHYSYLWTRDGALVANTLDLAGYPHFSRMFFYECAEIVHPDGYFLQKYNADGTVASGWHAAWDIWAKKQLAPIQEDETSLVLWALWKHYDLYREIEFLNKLYRPLIRKCADFLVEFRDESGLPKPSWNLWEDRRGVHTFTTASVVGALRAAANFAQIFGDSERASQYTEAADLMVSAMEEILYSREHKRFLRGLLINGDETPVEDATVDASLFGLFYFGAFSANNPKIAETMQAVEERLNVVGNIGGIARYENDGYMRVSEDFIGNPWVICTLWLAEYKIAIAETHEQLAEALEYLNWTVSCALPSGVLAEQIDPLGGAPVSVSPLTWSHSTFVTTVENYLARYFELNS
ncbi:MAG: glycoside hydrolase family 15 protein [Pyrinomonadaceae bacterium]